MHDSKSGCIPYFFKGVPFSLKLCPVGVWSERCLSSFLQFTEEKLGQAEKTELDTHLENLITRADNTKNWTEKIFRQTEVLLQPNPSKSVSFHTARDQNIDFKLQLNVLAGKCIEMQLHN